MSTGAAIAIGIAAGYVIGNIVGVILYVHGMEAGWYAQDSRPATLVAGATVLAFSFVGALVAYYIAR